MVSELEETFAGQLRILGVSGWEREVRFAPPRRWRFDFWFPARSLAVEIEGGTWSGGRHTRGKGYESDLEKYNTAQLMGYTVLRYTSTHVNDWSAAQQVAETVGTGGGTDASKG
jgi:very-short-patch-repair endonuclease